MDLGELWAIFGPGVSGAVFGAGWWFWVDAVVCSAVKVSFVHYLPARGNRFYRFDSQSFERNRVLGKSRLSRACKVARLLRISVLIDLGAVDTLNRKQPSHFTRSIELDFSIAQLFLKAASVGLLVQDALVKSGPSAWTGTAGVLQCVFWTDLLDFAFRIIPSVTRLQEWNELMCDSMFVYMARLIFLSAEKKISPQSALL
ncbi:hypothetical protein Scep_019297 [Stephania cephalantha]|uniref:Uncharacterized protein n=1 Tax=Stephania cephalantha TaxID=152367 RepID=A0AAP0IAK0_9MAGN